MIAPVAPIGWASAKALASPLADGVALSYEQRAEGATLQ
jgi:hypothetical protein